MPCPPHQDARLLHLARSTGAPGTTSTRHWFPYPTLHHHQGEFNTTGCRMGRVERLLFSTRALFTSANP